MSEQYQVAGGFLRGPRVNGDDDDGSMYLCQVVRCTECGALAHVEELNEPCGCDAPWVIYEAMHVEAKDGGEVFWTDDTIATLRARLAKLEAVATEACELRGGDGEGVRRRPDGHYEVYFGGRDASHMDAFTEALDALDEEAGDE